jgi:hypothetical protein
MGLSFYFQVVLKGLLVCTVEKHAAVKMKRSVTQLVDSVNVGQATGETTVNTVRLMTFSPCQLSVIVVLAKRFL